MATQVITNSGHDELIHDAQLDYYGRRLATCSADRSIKIFEIEGEQHRLTETIRGHNGAVWSLSWAHPKFGVLLASSSFTGQILIHRESAPNQWTPAYESSVHSASVNSVAWAPHEVGCLLAAASSDGSVSLLELNSASGQGQQQQAFLPAGQVQAHPLGANAVSWAPGAAAGALTAAVGGNTQAVRRFVSGGSDGLVKIWEVSPSGEITIVSELSGHTDWVRDVAWSSTVLKKSYIASAGQDKVVRIWSSENGNDWTCTALPPFEHIAWRVSWSQSGNVLAVSTGDNRISLWKEKLVGGWECIQTVEE